MLLGALDGECIVKLNSGEVKAVYQDFSRTVLAERIEGGYRLMGKRHLMRY